MATPRRLETDDRPALEASGDVIAGGRNCRPCEELHFPAERATCLFRRRQRARGGRPWILTQAVGVPCYDLHLLVAGELRVQVSFVCRSIWAMLVRFSAAAVVIMAAACLAVATSLAARARSASCSAALS